MEPRDDLGNLHASPHGAPPCQRRPAWLFAGRLIICVEVILPHAIFVQRLKGKGVAGVQHFHLHELTLTAVPESALKKLSRPHDPKHGPVFWQDAALAEPLTLGVIGRYSWPSAKECGKVSPWYGALKCDEALWMPKDCLKECEKNG